MTSKFLPSTQTSLLKSRPLYSICYLIIPPKYFNLPIPPPNFFIHLLSHLSYSSQYLFLFIVNLL